MKYSIFDAGPIISLTLNGMNQKEYKLDYILNNTLSPQCYPQGRAGLYIFGGCFNG